MQQPVSFPALLKEHDHVLYTALVAANAESILCWEQHLHRLQTSFQLYTSARSETAGVLSQQFISARLIPAVREACCGSKADTRHLRVVVIIYTDASPPSKEDSGWSVTAAASPAAWPSGSTVRLQPAKVIGPPRWLHGAKHGQWVRDRQQYEQQLAPGQQGLLATAAGDIYEGLTSNFFVVTHLPGSPSAQPRPVLQTAPEQDSLLPGITRRVVLQAAGQLGLQVHEQAPQVGQADLWQEAFVTSCFAGVQALGAITSASDAVLWSAQLDSNPWTQQIGHLVEQLMLQDGTVL